MEGIHRLNLGTAFSDDAVQDGARSEKDMEQLREAINRVGSDIRRTQQELHRQQDAHESHNRRFRVVAIVLAVLALLVVGACWLVYPTLKQQSKFAGDMIGLQSSNTTLGQRINSVEANLGATMATLPQLSSNMGQLEATMKSSLRTAGDQAQAAVTRAGQRIRDDVNKTMQAIQSRLAGVESNQREASERTNELQQQIAGLQRQVASMREESSTATAKIQQLEEAQQSRAQMLSRLDE